MKMFFLRILHRLHIRYIDNEVKRCLNLLTFLGQNNNIIVQRHLNDAKDSLYKVRHQLDVMRKEIKK